jgi:phosphoribosylanthranilate isomerase
MWIKVCGLTSDAAVAAALEAGADAIGFVFAPSVRRVAPAEAVRLAAPARGRASCVAVTRHPEPALVAEILDVFRPDVLQTDAGDLAELDVAGRCATLPVLRSGAAFSGPVPARVLYEGPVSGSGTVADWAAARDLARRTELVLAGGLNPRNVGEAVRAVRPFGVDVSSGVESAPGVKSPGLIREFVQAARAAGLECER